MFFSLLQQFTALPRFTRRRVRATFLGRWWLRCVHITFCVRPIHELPPHTILPIFGADSRRVQHTRCRLRDAFSTGARAARWGEICASRPVSGKLDVGYWDLVCADLSFLCCSRTVRFARLCGISIQRTEGWSIGGFRVRSKFLENFLSILHNNIAMGMPGRDLYVCMYRTM